MLCGAFAVGLHFAKKEKDNSTGIISYIIREIDLRIQGDFWIFNTTKLKSIWCASPLCRLVNNKPVVSFQ